MKKPIYNSKKHHSWPFTMRIHAMFLSFTGAQAGCSSVCVCVWLRIFFLNFQNWVPIVRDAWLVEIQYAYKYLDTIHTCCCILYCTCHVVSLCMLTVHICLTSALNEPVHAWNDKSISFFYPHSNEASSAESKRIYIHGLASGTAVMLPLLMSHIS